MTKTDTVVTKTNPVRPPKTHNPVGERETHDQAVTTQADQGCSGVTQAEGDPEEAPDLVWVAREVSWRAGC